MPISPLQILIVLSQSETKLVVNFGTQMQKKLQDILDIQMNFFKWNLTCCACFKNRKALSPLHTAIHDKLAVLLCSEVQ